MRINYEVPDDLHHRAKAQAALSGQTLRQFVITALEAAVARSEDEHARGDRGHDG